VQRTKSQFLATKELILINKSGKKHMDAGIRQTGQQKTWSLGKK